MNNVDILIVDDEMGIRELLAEILQDEGGYTIAQAENIEEARQFREQQRPQVVLLDIWLPDGNGIDLLKEWSDYGLLDMPVIMMSGHASKETGEETSRLGAFCLLEKPITLQTLLTTVASAMKYSKMQADLSVSLKNLGNSPAVVELQKSLEEARKTKNPILLSGEYGSPFNTVARFFQKDNQPWIAPEKEQLWLDNTRDWLRAAQNGVLYLGCFTSYSLETQKAIYNTITKTESHNVRIIGATDRPLEDLFRSDLYEPELMQVLSGNIISIMPLRKQLEDLPHLITQILVKLVESRQVQMVKFNNSAINALKQYDWPGNMEQLKAIIKSLALCANNGVVEEGQVEVIIEQYRNRKGSECTGFDFDLPLRELREVLEKNYFEYHIRQENSNMSKVAQKVGLERTHLYRKLKQLGIKVNKKD